MHAVCKSSAQKREDTLRKMTLIAPMVLAGWTISASAETQVSVQKCTRDYSGASICTTTSGKVEEPPRPKPLNSKAEAAAAAAALKQENERIEKWEAYCQPTGKIDEFGVTRLSYAHKGCEFGISEPPQLQKAEASLAEPGR